MTLEKFLKECENLREGFTWSNQKNLIRGKRKGSNDSYCPMTAMCFHKTGIDLPKCLFRKAGLTINLEPDDCIQILTASDNGIVMNSELYPRLLKALGITK